MDNNTMLILYRCRQNRHDSHSGISKDNEMISNTANHGGDEAAISANVTPKPESTQLTHRELVKLSREAINNIVESDPLLSGLPFDVTLEEIKAQIAVAQGQAITLFLNREELPRISVVVPPHDTTVLQLKKAVKRHVNLSLKRENIRKKISWKQIWRKYDLSFQHFKLHDNSENIKAYRIGNKAELRYVKKRRQKNGSLRN